MHGIYFLVLTAFTFIIKKINAMDLLPNMKDCGFRMRRECRERFPRHRLQRKPLISDPCMHHARAAMHVGIANPLWRGKRSPHSRCMRNPQFYISGKRPMLSCVSRIYVHVALVGLGHNRQICHASFLKQTGCKQMGSVTTTQLPANDMKCPHGNWQKFNTLKLEEYGILHATLSSAFSDICFQKQHLSILVRSSLNCFLRDEFNIRYNCLW